MSNQYTKKRTASSEKSKGRTANNSKANPGRTSARTQTKKAAVQARETAERKSFLKKEAAFVIISFLALFLFLSNFGILGKAGQFVSSIQKGCFGFGAYVFPVAVVYLVYMFIREERGVLFWIKIASVLILFMCVCSMLHLALGSRMNCRFTEYYSTAKSGFLYKEAAGGAIGGFIADRLVLSIAGVGAWLLLLMLSILCIVMITEKSIINAARKSARKATDTAIAGSRYARDKFDEERIRLESRREAAMLRRKEEAMERDLRDREAIMPGVTSSVFDLTAGRENSLPDPSGFSFDENERSIRLKEMSRTDEVPEKSTEDVMPATITGTEVPMQETVSAEPDYMIDEVPFNETADERYRAYGKMLNGDKIDLKVAQRMGFAVSRDSVRTERDDGFLDNGYRKEEEDHLHRPLDPEEIIYPVSAQEEENLKIPETEPVRNAESVPETPVFRSVSDGYDDMFHITDEQRESVYDEREKAAKEETATEPFGSETFAAAEYEAESAQPDRTREIKPKAVKPVHRRPYQFPPVSLLKKGARSSSVDTNSGRDNARKLEQVLSEFGVGVTVTNVVKGPRVTRYEMTPDVGVKVSRITSLSGDIKLALAASELRIEAPIPGKSAVGIEVPNNESVTVTFRDIMETDEFRTSKSKLTWGVGLDIQGSPIVGDIAKMPHLLVSGTTGSGKSVGINSIIMSVIYRSKPEEVKMILVDPKVVELSVYDGIPHLLAPVVTKPEQALAVLNKACAEMQHRYNLFKESNTRNIIGYNEKVEEICRNLPEDAEKPEKLPYILIIIDELSELMMHSKRDVESAIVSLTQLARAAGIHLVVATQRPSVDVVTGLIKSNIPSRVAYRLPSGIDSRTILDSYGAETLLGNGDMLYKPGNLNSPIRVQGAYLSDGEVEEVVEWLKKHNSVFYDGDWENLKAVQPSAGDGSVSGDEETDDGRDEYFVEAGWLITEKKKASIGLLQRKFKIGFNRASRIMEQLNEAGVVSEGEGTKERQILMTPEEFREKF